MTFLLVVLLKMAILNQAHPTCIPFITSNQELVDVKRKYVYACCWLPPWGS